MLVCERSMDSPHRVSVTAAWGRSQAAIVAGAWTASRSWSARKGSLSNRDNGIRRASGTMAAMGAGPVVACCRNTSTTSKSRRSRLALRTAGTPWRVLSNRSKPRQKRSRALVVEGKRTLPTFPMSRGTFSSTHAGPGKPVPTWTGMVVP
jgi:hypothetical protein